MQNQNGDIRGEAEDPAKQSRSDIICCCCGCLNYSKIANEAYGWGHFGYVSTTLDVRVMGENCIVLY